MYEGCHLGGDCFMTEVEGYVLGTTPHNRRSGMGVRFYIPDFFSRIIF